MSHPKTTIAGYVATAFGVIGLLADVLPPKYAVIFAAIGQMANGVGNIMSADGGH